MTHRDHTTMAWLRVRRRLPSRLLFVVILILTVNGHYSVTSISSNTKTAFMTILGGKKTINHHYKQTFNASGFTSFTTSIRTTSNRNHAAARLFYSSSSSSSSGNKEQQDDDDDNKEEQHNTAKNKKGQTRQTIKNHGQRMEERQRTQGEGASSNDSAISKETKGLQSPVDWRSIRAQLVSHEQEQARVAEPSLLSPSTHFCIPVFGGTNQNNKNINDGKTEQTKRTSNNNNRQSKKKKKKKRYHSTTTSTSTTSNDPQEQVPFFCRNTAADESSTQKEETQNDLVVLDEMKLQDAMEEEFVSTMDADSKKEPSWTILEDEGWLFGTGDMLEQGTILLHNAAARSDNEDNDEYSYYTSKTVRHHDVSLQDQYLHKSIVLILQYDKHDPTIPVQGVLLNRPTNLHLSTPGVSKEEDNDDETWNIWYGGNEHGLPTPDDEEEVVCSPKLFCLYQPKEDEAITKIYPIKEIMHGLYFVPIEVAHEMVRQDLASPSADFWTFAGIVEWNSPHELLNEVHNGKWKALSIDSNTIMKLRTKKGHEGEEQHKSSSWHTLTSMLSKDEDDSSSSSSRGTRHLSSSLRPSSSFEDFMLHQWSMKHLVFDEIPECFQVDEEDDFDESDDDFYTTNDDDKEEEMNQTNAGTDSTEVEGEEESLRGKPHLSNCSTTHPFFMGETISSLLNKNQSETLFDETEILMVPDELYSGSSDNDSTASSSFISMLPIRSNHNDYSTLTGRLVRASTLEGQTTHRPYYLLNDQELYNSLVLIIDDDHDSDVTIGVILNLPTDEQAPLSQGNKHASTGVISHDPMSLDFKQQTNHIVPIRYGGPYEMTFYESKEDESEKSGRSTSSNDNSSSIMYLHLNPQLRLSKVGTPVSYELGRERYIWKCTQDEVEQALREVPGVTPSDFIAIRGVYVWPKYLVSSSEDDTTLYVQGGIQEELDDGKMELVPQSQLSQIWTTLKRQSLLLSDYSLDTNMKLSQKAWNLASLPPKQSSSRRNRTFQQTPQGNLLYENQDMDEPSSVEEVRQNYSRQDLFSFGSTKQEDAAESILSSLNQEEEGLKDVEGAKEFVMKLLQQQQQNSEEGIATEVSKLLLNVRDKNHNQIQTTTNIGSLTSKTTSISSPNQMKQLCHEAHKRWMYMNLFQPSEEEDEDENDDIVVSSETLRP